MVAKISKKHPELFIQQRICQIFNKKGFNFEVVSANYDLYDPLHNIVVEIKKEGYAPEQALFAAVHSSYSIEYIGLIDSDIALFFKCPERDEMLTFYNGIREEKGEIAPSEVPRRFRRRALEILGDPITVCETRNPCSIEDIDGFTKINVTNHNLLLIKF